MFRSSKQLRIDRRLSQPLNLLLLVLFLLGGDFLYAMSPLKSNPVFEAFIAQVLPVLDKDEETQLRALDEFVEIFQQSLGRDASQRIQISSLEEYKKLRNSRPSQLEEAQEHISRHGILSPFNITTSKDVFDEVVRYELNELSEFQKFAQDQAGEAIDESLRSLGISASLFNLFPKLQGLAENLRNVTDGLASTISEGLQSRGSQILDSQNANPLAKAFAIGHLIAASTVTATYGVAVQSVQRVAYSESLWNKARDIAHTELFKLKSMSRADKLELIASVKKNVVEAFSKGIGEAVSQFDVPEGTPIDSFTQNIVTQNIIGPYLIAMPMEQKARMAWQVLSSDNFFELTEAEQFQQAGQVLGPIMQKLTEDLSMFESLTEIQQFICCLYTPLTKKERKLLLQRVAELSSSEGISIQILNDSKHQGALYHKVKVAFVINDRRGTGELWTKRPKIHERLNADIELLKSVLNPTTLFLLDIAGLYAAPDILDSIIQQTQDDLDTEGFDARRDRLSETLRKTQIQSQNSWNISMGLSEIIEVDQNTIVEIEPEGLNYSDFLSQHPEMAPEVIESIVSQYLSVIFQPEERYILPSIDLRKARFVVNKSSKSVQVTFKNIRRANFLSRNILEQFQTSAAEVLLKYMDRLEGEPNLETIQQVSSELFAKNFKIDSSVIDVSKLMISAVDLLGEEKVKALIFDLVKNSVFNSPGTFFTRLAPTAMKALISSSPEQTKLPGYCEKVFMWPNRPF